MTEESMRAGAETRPYGNGEAAAAETSSGLRATFPSGEGEERTLEVVAAEIRAFTASMLGNIIEIGRRLCEAKEMLPYGEFGAWVEDNTGYGKSTANNFMRLYEEYGKRQKSLFGAELEDVQTFGKLSYSKALALLAVPSEEREEFVEAHDVEAMTTRELQQAIRERDEARKQAEEASGKLADLSEDYDKLSSEKDVLEDEREDLKKQIRELESRPIEVAVQEPDPEAVERAVQEAVAEAGKKHANELTALQKKLEAAKKAEEKAKTAQKKAEEEKSAAEKSAEEKTESSAKAAEAETAALKHEIERLKKELAMSDAAVTTFRERFSTWQTAYNSMMDTLGSVDGETAEKLRGAVRAMLTRWEEALMNG